MHCRPQKRKYYTELTPEELEEQLTRTVRVTNVSVFTNIRSLRALFKSAGKIENIRLVNVPVGKKGLSPLEARKSRNFMSGRDSCGAFVLFKEKESADKAVSTCNLRLHQGKHMFVHHYDLKSCFDHRRSVFVGHCPYGEFGFHLQFSNLQPKLIHDTFIFAPLLDIMQMWKKKSC